MTKAPDIVDLLNIGVDRGASDLVITVGVPPMIKIDGEFQPTEYEPLTPQETRRLTYALMDEKQQRVFEENKELDFSFSLPGKGRFRVNIFMQRGSVGGVLRVVPNVVKTFEELGLPKSMADIAMSPRGLVLLTGPTGSGKSTTLASMLDYVNERKRAHIVTIEDPIEFFHRHKSSIINQREIGQDTHDFARALRSVLRQAPDVILVGEMRDYETISAAITAAETGHLVMGTLHTNSAPETVDRIVDVFPENQQEQVRVQLANNLVAVITQQLLPKAFGGGRTMAYEMMIATPAVRALIREGKSHQLVSVIQTGGQYNMITMDAYLADLYRRKLISYEVGLARSVDQKEFTRLSGGPAGQQQSSATVRR
jgi:twitching motility protein PilT